MQPAVATSSKEYTAHQQVTQKCTRLYWEHEEPLYFSFCLSFYGDACMKAQFWGPYWNIESLSPPGAAYVKMRL